MAKLKRQVLCGVLSALIGAANAHASLQLNETPGGSAQVTYQGPATFVNNGTTPVYNSVLEDTIISKTFGPGVSTILFDNVTFAAGDLDFTAFGGGFRWTESIKNNTGVAWTSLVLNLSETSGFFFGDTEFSPSFVDISYSPSGDYTITNDDLPGDPDSFGTAVRSNGNRTLTFTFDSPLQPAARFGIHAPIQGLSGSTSFELSQSVFVVPEPSSFVVMSLGFLVAIGAVIAGRRYGVSCGI